MKWLLQFYPINLWRPVRNPCHCDWHCSSTAVGLSALEYLLLFDGHAALFHQGGFTFVVGGLMWQSCLGRMMVFDSRQTNGCRRSSRRARPLVMTRLWMRSAGVCRQALHPSQARTKHDAYRGGNVSSIFVDEGCSVTKPDKQSLLFLFVSIFFNII